MSSARAMIVPVTPLQQNCTLLWCEATARAVVIDPGGDLERVHAAIAQAGVTVDRIWLTHGHIDHAGGAEALREALKVPVEGPHRTDEFLLRSLVEQGLKWGMPEARNVTPDRWLDEGDSVSVGKVSFDILHCPGHSPGSVVFVNRPQNFALVGDVLFQGSIGRSDLPGGDPATLLQSIKTKLLPLSDDMAFICGHGPTSTIGHERATNPYLR
ncbi:MAG TPA: MBL fold metallo-hydrolase [Aliidongia sp.]|uniref:MBL fold metallo-hydrolase n=1 Tax=Aliidongia sp. TaxID=1914230 RepID=UPI002DDCE2AC|nr:MBL fold metallo-hydrolase [Aliidongia sp.]HEV2675932.1 MBL fold metallo-hydrolase [Aliidongia sp.]